MKAIRRQLLMVAGLAIWTAPWIQPGAQPSTSYDDVAPILAARCVLCHAGSAAPLGLQLDSYEALVKGSSNGPVVKSGDAAGSELMRRLMGTKQPRMPMTGPPFLTDAEIAKFESFIAGGLRRGGAVTGTAAGAAAAAAPLTLQPGQVPDYRHVAPIFGVALDLENLKSERTALKNKLRELEQEQRKLESELKKFRQAELQTKRQIEALSTLLDDGGAEQKSGPKAATENG
jgi:hypothetical protein